MKIECNKKDLKDAILATEKVTAKNPTLPVLSLIVIEGKDKDLMIKATNLEVGVETLVKARVIKPGKVAIQAQLLNQLLNSINEDELIVLESVNDNLSITTQKTNTILKSFPSDDFPLIPRIKNGSNLTIPISNFLTGVKSVIYSAATSDIRPEITSVYIYQDSGFLVFVATDSFRLAEKKIKFSNQELIPPVIIPFKNITDIYRIIELEEGEVEIKTTDNQISFSTNNFYITSRLINGIFPDYRQIMPKQSKTEIIILKNEIINYLKMSAIFSDKFNQISFNISFSDNSFEVYSKNNDLGENTIKSNPKIFGEDLIIHFNAKYILEALPFIQDDEVKLSFNGSNKPILVSGVKDLSFNYLVMPVNR